MKEQKTPTDLFSVMPGRKTLMAVRAPGIYTPELVRTHDEVLALLGDDRSVVDIVQCYAVIRIINRAEEHKELYLISSDALLTHLMASSPPFEYSWVFSANVNLTDADSVAVSTEANRLGCYAMLDDAAFANR